MAKIVRRLPVLRVEFDDPEHTWVHIDPYTASVFNRLDDRGRVKRWLFTFLHSFDSRGFVESRPLWDVTLILLSIGGFVLCTSGMVIGWRRLRRPVLHGSTMMHAPLAGPVMIFVVLACTPPPSGVSGSTD